LLKQANVNSIQSFLSSFKTIIPNYYSSQFERPDHSPWTNEEDEQIESLITQLGPKWKIISQYFPSRTISSIKYGSQFLSRRKTKKDPLIPIPSIGFEGMEFNSFLSIFNC